MKITPDVLHQLGATVLDPQSFRPRYVLTLDGQKYEVTPRGEHWEFMGHPVTDVEELILFAYREGYVDGKDDLRGEIKNLLHIRDKDRKDG